jgi:type II secretion system protein H
MLALGNKPLRPRPGGFTLLELLVVLVIIAVAASVAVLALPRNTLALDEDAARLAVRLDTARARAVALQAPVRITIDATGYKFMGYSQGQWQDLPAPLSEQRFASGELAVAVAGAPWLGPEPVGEPFEVRLGLAGEQRVIRSDGVTAFALVQ